MEKLSIQRRFKTQAQMLVLSFTVLFLLSGCSKEKGTSLYHRFPDKYWARFNLLSFEIPVKDAGNYNIYLFACFTRAYPYEVLDFNMTMNTPAGEERIKEYQMKVKSVSGGFVIECSQDSCYGEILLKKELNISKSGVLKVGIENLTPRLRTDGVRGIGIRIFPV